MPSRDPLSIRITPHGLIDVASPTPENRFRLLLVDDEPRLLASLCEMLAEREYDLITARCGAEAVEALSAMSFDLVLLDLRLPDFGGHEIMDFMHARKIHTSVIVLSGETGMDGPIGALKRGAYDYLRKPYTGTELFNTIDRALKQRTLERENERMGWQLECSEQLHRHLVDSSPDIIYTLDNEGRITFVNDRAQQVLGFSREHLVGKHYSTIVHDDDLERAYYVFSEHRIGEHTTRTVELRLKSLGGDPLQRTYENTLITLSFGAAGAVSAAGVAHGSTGEPLPGFHGTYCVARDITDRKHAEELISHQAHHDVLTDLPNRILFKDRLDLAMLQSMRNNTELAVMFVDLDRFKLVNDTLGHLKGDELLQQVANRLRDNLRRGDTLARLGGDEFTIFLPDLHNRIDITVVANKFLGCLQQPFLLDGHEVHISASIGIAIYPADGLSMDELLRRADMAMYKVKAEGKNGYSFYDQKMLDASHQKLTLEQSLRRALEQNELEMYYQPQIDVLSGDIIGAEGLMRWNHPERGLLSAGEFIPFAEENGLMIPISDWMLNALCRDVLHWNAIGGLPVQLSLNLSPQYLDRGDFVEKIRSALRQYDLPPTQIEVEITENICIRNPQYAIDQLNKLSQLGISVAIDDFGTGYSSLAYLHRFPIHTIKIDQSFIKEIQKEHGPYPVVLAIISIAKGLGLKLVAEGVETEMQARYLEQSGCTTMQGYLYHRPLPNSVFMKLLEQKRASVPHLLPHALQQG